jgi:predicted ribosome quality control (RQC) complex YloA/Tae2 family protein
MVFYFKSRCGQYTLYMGRDKYENEDLIKYGLPEDVWFHVDDLSSAHVYLRMKPGQTLDDISDDLLLDCASLVKANSIAGCKVSNLREHEVLSVSYHISSLASYTIHFFTLCRNHPVMSFTHDGRI